MVSHCLNAQCWQAMSCESVYLSDNFFFVHSDYKLLGILKRQFPKVPLLGLTATATSSVVKDCQKMLCVPDTTTLTAPFNRPNLYYEVQ